METKFIEFCKNGDLDSIKQLINSHEINIHAKDEEGFRWACENGHKHIVEYLINLYKRDNKYAIVNIHANDEYGFRWACMNGHKHIVKYLLSGGCYLHGYNDSKILL